MEARLFEEGTIPEWTTPEWYSERETAPHLEQAGHHERLMLTSEYIQHQAPGASSVVDLGAGDGGLLSTLPPKYRRWGYDLQQTNVDAAKLRGEDVSLLDVVAEPDRVEWADVVSATEMLEHLVDPHALLRRAYESPALYLVASSPYTETAESHYGFHTWAWDEEGYRAMIEAAGWKVAGCGRAWICQVVVAYK